ncbi:MAG: DinB family protein [Planctomycetaceae bacterium]|nr:DinB family protein [Planctomycetaceae bacterium]
MSTSSLLDRYAAGPALVRQAVTGLTREQLLARPIPGKWSTLEVVAHLADFEIVGCDRLAAVIAEDEPMLPGRDEQRYAARLGYAARDLEEQLRLIEACRANLLRVMRSLTAADWQRRGIHTEAGPLTLEQLLERVVRHVEHHVPFIAEKRRALQIPA